MANVFDSIRWKGTTLVRWIGRFAVTVAVHTATAPMTLAHPHVFIDGGVDFRLGPDHRLQALEVTWLYDPFETLYMLAANEMGLNDQGGLNEADRLELTRRLSIWPEDFDGSAHLSVDGSIVALEWPENLDVQMVDGRLQLTFTRALADPVNPAGKQVEVAFFESTYFFDFTITNAPQIVGPARNCSIEMTPFDPDSGDSALLEILAKLSREETSDIDNVGAVFADRTIMQCD